MTDINEDKWFQYFSTSQNSFSTFYEKKINFLGFRAVALVKTFPLLYQLLLWDWYRRNKSDFSTSAQVEIQFRPFLKRKFIFVSSCCRIREELSITVSIETAGVGQVLTKPIVPVKEVVECFNMCKAAMERRGLKVNNGKMKILVSKNEIL